jgi:hypothetical protein
MRWILVALALLLAPVQAFAVISYDAESEGTGTTTLSWTHTPVGTPRGVLVFCMVATISTDVFSGATYGGTAMTAVGSAADSSGEVGFTEAYFLGASIPTGAQTAVCTVSSGTNTKHGVAFTFTNNNASDMETAGADFCTVSADVDDPSCTIASQTSPTMAAAAMHSGQNAEASTTAGSGFTIRHSNDYGTSTTASETMTTQQSSGTVTAAFVTAASDDVAMVGVAIKQITADPEPSGHRPAAVRWID